MSQQIPKYIQKLNGIFDFQQELVEVMLRHKGSDNACHVSQTKIAEELGVSPTLISKTIQRLIGSGTLRKFKAGQYIVLEKDVKKHGLYPWLMGMVSVYASKPELARMSYNQQAEMVGVDMNAIQTFWAYLRYATNNFTNVEE